MDGIEFNLLLSELETRLSLLIETLTVERVALEKGDLLAVHLSSAKKERLALEIRGLEEIRQSKYPGNLSAVIDKIPFGKSDLHIARELQAKIISCIDQISLENDRNRFVIERGLDTCEMMKKIVFQETETPSEPVLYGRAGRSSRQEVRR